MKKLKVAFAMFAGIVCVLLAFVSYATADSLRSEILVVNDTKTQVSVYITTMEDGRKHWTIKPGTEKYLSIVSKGVRARVRKDDLIEIGDWGKAEVRDIAVFEEGVWKVSVRRAWRLLKMG